MAQWRNTIYTERMGGSPHESFGMGDSHATRIYDTDYLSRGQFMQDFYGFTTIMPTGLSSPFGQTLSRTTPHTHFWNELAIGSANSPSDMYAVGQVECQGIAVGDATNDLTPPQEVQDVFTSAGSYLGNEMLVPLYKLARFTVGYSTLPFDIAEDNDPLVIGGATDGAPGFPSEDRLNRYVTKIPHPNADYITLGQGVMKFASGPASGAVVPFSIGKIQVNFDLSYTWNWIPEVAVASLSVNPTLASNTNFIDLALGTVNSVQLGGYSPGTLLLLAVVFYPMRHPTQGRIYNIEYRFKYFGPGHHKVFYQSSSGVNGYVEISSDGSAHAIGPSTPTGKHIYDVYDHRSLFFPPN